MHADLTKVRQALLQPAVATPASSPTGGTIALEVVAASGRRRRPGWVDLPRARHRHRHDARAGRPAVPAVHAGRRLDHAQVRRHRAGPDDHPPVLPDDGRRRRRSRASRATARPSPSACRPGSSASPTDADDGGRREPRAGRRARRAGAGHRRRPDRPRPGPAHPREGGLPRPVRLGRRGGAAPGPPASAPTRSPST